MRKLILFTIITVCLVSCASTVESITLGAITPTATPDPPATVTITPTISGWSQSTSLVKFKEMVILSANEVWAISEKGTVIHTYPRYVWDAQPYEYSGEFNFAKINSLTAIYFNSSTDGWLTTWRGGQIYHWDGQEWKIVTPDGSNNHWHDISFANSNLGWVVGCYTQDDGYFPALSKWNGVELQNVSLTGIVDKDHCLSVIDVVSETDAWVIAQNRPKESTCLNGGPIILLHWNGVEWQKIPTPARMQGWGCNGWGSMSATGPTDIWLINNSEDTIAHWNGTDWNFTMLPFGYWDGVDGTGPSVLALTPNDVWVGGRALYHWDGTEWIDLHYDVRDNYIVDLQYSDGHVWALTQLGLVLKLSNQKK